MNLNIAASYPIILRQADMCEQGLVMAQRVKLLADICHIQQQVTHWNMAQDA